MALPTSGSISMRQIRDYLGKSGKFSLNDPEARKLARKTSGALSMKDFRGKARSLITQTNVYTADTTIVVPDYESVVITLLGAGGPDADENRTTAATKVTGGGLVTSLIANPGGKGRRGANYVNVDVRSNDESDYVNYSWGKGIRGPAGTASGGDQNITGGGKPGDTDSDYRDGPGGYGGKCVLTRSEGAAGAPDVGATLTVTAGKGYNTPTVTFEWTLYQYN